MMIDLKKEWDKNYLNDLYLMKDGSLMTLQDFVTAFHIVTGHDPYVNHAYEPTFNMWFASLFDTTIDSKLENPSIEYLIKKGAFIQAVKAYRWRKNCSLLEAKEACDTIRDDLRARGEIV